jgi:hypothetical protein
VAPPRLQHTAVWLGRRSAHAWKSPTARPYPKRSLGSASAAEAFAAALTSSVPEQSAAPEARTVHARKPPADGPPEAKAEWGAGSGPHGAERAGAVEREGESELPFSIFFPISFF